MIYVSVYLVVYPYFQALEVKINNLNFTVMKKIIVLSIIIFFGFRSYSQLEVYGRYTQGGKVDPDINLYGEKKLFSDSSKFSLTYFALVEQTWAEGLVGISYSPKEWVSFGFMAGVEQSPALYRFLGSLWLGKDKTSFLALVEKGDGTDNYWYKITASYKATKKLTLGLRAWRYNGVGPVGTVELTKLSSRIWIMPMYDIEAKKKRISLGINISL